MIRTIILLVGMLGLSTPAFAADYPIKTEKNETWYVHGDTIIWAINEVGKLQVEGVVTISENGSHERVIMTMIGCDHKIGGKIAEVDANGNILGKQIIWLHSGKTMLDEIARTMCQALLDNKGEGKVSPPVKTPSKNSI